MRNIWLQLAYNYDSQAQVSRRTNVSRTEAGNSLRPPVSFVIMCIQTHQRNPRRPLDILWSWQTTNRTVPSEEIAVCKSLTCGLILVSSLWRSLQRNVTLVSERTHISKDSVAYCTLIFRINEEKIGFRFSIWYVFLQVETCCTTLVMSKYGNCVNKDKQSVSRLAAADDVPNNHDSGVLIAAHDLDDHTNIN